MTERDREQASQLLYVLPGMGMGGGNTQPQGSPP